MTLAWTDDKLSSGQAQNDVKFDFQVKFDLEGQGRSPHKTIGTLTEVFCICAPNFVILAWTSEELSRGQTSDWHTDRHTHTDAGNDNTRRPWVKNYSSCHMTKAISVLCTVLWSRSHIGQDMKSISNTGHHVPRKCVIKEILSVLNLFKMNKCSPLTWK